MAEPVGLTDYLGSSPYADGELTTTGDPPDDWSLSQTMRYAFPFGQETAATGEVQYFHQDLTGSILMTTDEGADSTGVEYSAFGQLLDSSGCPCGSAPENFPRYQYGGQWGYESSLLELEGVNSNLPAIALQHVGYRWYEPSIGRFIQRDPIGIFGGLNVYEYAGSEPLIAIDPDGLKLDSDVIVKEDEIIVHWYNKGRKLWIFPYHEYKSTQRFPILPHDETNNDLYNSCIGLTRQLSKEKVEALRKGIEKLDEGMRNQAKRLMKGNGVLGTLIFD